MGLQSSGVGETKMAVTKIWAVRGAIEKSIDYIENPEKTAAVGDIAETEEDLTEAGDDISGLQALEDVMEYAENEEKTEKKFFVTGINCETDQARTQFLSVKRQYHREGGIVAFHAYQSFAPGETTPEQAHAIGCELAERLWGDRFQVVVATHLNTHCLHNHFVLNSVSFRDGKRYHDCKQTYRQLQNVSDEICREHGLSVVERLSGERNSSFAEREGKAGHPTRFEMTRNAIDEAISRATGIVSFENILRSMGYRTQFSSKRKYWTITPVCYERPIRLARLGPEYDRERILERIAEKTAEKTAGNVSPETVDDPPVQNPDDRGTEDHGSMPAKRRLPFEEEDFKEFKLQTEKGGRHSSYRPLTTGQRMLRATSGLYRQYLYHCYRLGAFSKTRRRSWQVPAPIRDSLLFLDKLTKETQLLGDNRITTLEELNAYEGKIVERMNGLVEERRGIVNEMRRVSVPEERLMELKVRRTQITEELKQCRAEIFLIKDIREHSLERAKALEAVDRERTGKER